MWTLAVGTHLLVTLLESMHRKNFVEGTAGGEAVRRSLVGIGVSLTRHVERKLSPKETRKPAQPRIKDA